MRDQPAPDPDERHRVELADAIRSALRHSVPDYELEVLARAAMGDPPLTADEAEPTLTAR